MEPPVDPRQRLIFALDVSSAREARLLTDELAGEVGVFKVGLELWSRTGPPFARELIDEGHEVFLDLKLCDIPRTVAGAVRAVADLGARFLTLHGPPTSVRAAAEAAGASSLTLLGVTLLTSVSLDEAQAFSGVSSELSLGDLVRRRAELFIEAGCGGLVCSPREVADLRLLHPGVNLVTPGVRPPGADVDDQVRVATPREAAAAGADYLVVGRPIRDAQDRRAAARRIVEEMAAGFAARAPV